MQLIGLFTVMFGIGALAFGSGYAIVGMVQSYLVDKLHWITLSEFTSGLVIGQVTPGPLSTMVAYVGFKIAGLTGAVVATLGLLTPSFLSSVAIAAAYDRFRRATWMQAAVRGVRIAVVALLANAIITLTWDGGAIGDGWAVLIALGTFLATGPWKRDPLLPFIAAAVVGAFLYH